MQGLKAKIKEASDSIRRKTTLSPALGIVLGTGLGQLVESIEVETASLMNRYHIFLFPLWSPMREG